MALCVSEGNVYVMCIIHRKEGRSRISEWGGCSSPQGLSYVLPFAFRRLHHPGQVPRCDAEGIPRQPERGESAYDRQVTIFATSHTTGLPLVQDDAFYLFGEGTGTEGAPAATAEAVVALAVRTTAGLSHLAVTMSSACV